MSLCIVVRPADGGIIMCADTAISTKVMGQAYRVENFEDEEKIIEHNGTLVFCSGTYNKCTPIREYIRSLETVDVEKVQIYAQTLFNHDSSDDSTGIMILQKDGTLIGMLSAQDFKPTLMKWPAQGMGIHVLGFHMKEALVAAYEATQHCDYAIGVVEKAYAAVLCEEVGGHIWAYSCREDTPWRKVRGAFDEPAGIRKAVADNFASKVHCIISAQDFLLNDGTSMKSALNDSKSKVKGEYIDIRGANIVNKQGDTVLYIDETGIHWAQKYSPFKYQYSVTANGPWHDEQAANDEYRRESTDGGITWGPGIKYVAKDGRDGANGSDADVTRANIENALAYARNLGSSYLAMDSAGAPILYGGKIYGSEIYAGGTMGSGGVVGRGSVISLTDTGIQMYNTLNNTNLEIKSDNVPGIGAVTALYNQSSPLLLNAQTVMLGQNLGTSTATGIGISMSGTVVSGPVHFSGDVTGVEARFG